MTLQERISFLFTGLAYIVVAVLIVTRPQFFYYWIAGIFVLQGAASIFRGFTVKDKDEGQDADK